MFCLRVDPDEQWFGCRQMRPTHQDFTQPLIVVEEVGSITKPMSLQER
jgi:hypothetical protein